MTEARIPVEWLEWGASARLTGGEAAVLLYLLRQTYGWSRETTDRWAGMGAIGAKTGLDVSSIRRALRGLQARGVLRPVSDSGPTTPSSYAVVVPVGWGVVSAPPPSSHATPSRPRHPLAPTPGGEVAPTPGGVLAPVPGGGVVSAPPQNSHRNRETEQGEEQQQQQRRPRDGAIHYGPDPVTGDVEAAARTLFSRMQRQEAGRPPKHPSAVDMERLALILTGPDAARAADVERACGAAGMGFRAFLLCWDDDGMLLPDRLPSRKAPGERPEPEWAVRRRRLAEALERRREIYAEIDAAGGETVTPEQEVELNEISRLERLGA